MKRTGRLYHPTDVRIYEHRKWLAIEAELDGDPVRLAQVGFAHHLLCLNARQNHYPDGVYASEIEMLRALRGLGAWTLEVMRNHGVLDRLAIHGFSEWVEEARKVAQADDRQGRRSSSPDVRTSVRTDDRAEVRNTPVSVSVSGDGESRARIDEPDSRAPQRSLLEEIRLRSPDGKLPEILEGRWKARGSEPVLSLLVDRLDPDGATA